MCVAIQDGVESRRGLVRMLVDQRHGWAFVRGLQASPEESLLACPKHFAGYGASESGLDYNRTYISDIELFNVYFPPFAAAFDAAP